MDFRFNPAQLKENKRCIGKSLPQPTLQKLQTGLVGLTRTDQRVNLIQPTQEIQGRISSAIQHLEPSLDKLYRLTRITLIERIAPFDHQGSSCEMQISCFHIKAIDLVQ